uniref:Uncharacterized protein n=1 Tax=Lepeophtheirus salmonis TaxID=72036 RepID=A0A0K2V8J6_LEPSM
MSIRRVAVSLCDLDTFY